MKNNIYKFLFLGDIFGKTGREVIKEHLAEIKELNNIDFTVANLENIAHGSGINKKGFKEMMDAGIDVGTSGNHHFQRKDVFKLIEEEVPNLLMPANFPEGVKGNRYGIFQVKDIEVLIINLHGQVMITQNFSNPFKILNRLLKQFDNFSGPIFIDLHAEATSEKRAMSLYFDGRITGLFGTHTHIQTADERILPKGTAYITDLGMCGPYDSVIGITLDSVIDSFLYALPSKFEPATSQPSIQGVIVEYDAKEKKVRSIERVLKVY